MLIGTINSYHFEDKQNNLSKQKHRYTHIFTRDMVQLYYFIIWFHLKSQQNQSIVSIKQGNDFEILATAQNVCQITSVIYFRVTPLPHNWLIIISYFSDFK